MSLTVEELEGNSLKIFTAEADEVPAGLEQPHGSGAVQLIRITVCNLYGVLCVQDKSPPDCTVPKLYPSL